MSEEEKKEQKLTERRAFINQSQRGDLLMAFIICSSISITIIMVAYFYTHR